MARKTSSDISDDNREREKVLSSSIHAMGISILFVVIAYLLYRFQMFPFANIVALILFVWGAWGMAWGLREFLNVMIRKSR